MAEARTERRLAAILAADVAGYSRLMGIDEEGTLATLKAYQREILDPKIAEHRGRTVKTSGDGALVEFASVVDAVRCATEIQRAVSDRNKSIPQDRSIAFRIGINVGDIIADGGDIFGDGVNVAARLEALAEPGGICVSSRVHEDVDGRLDVTFEDAGTQELKNIARPVQVYRVLSGTPRSKIAASPTPKLSIAVLPFQNMSSDQEQTYFSEGLTANLTTDLSRVSGLLVIASTTTATLRDKALDVKQISRELDVRYVLQGGVQKIADTVRVNARLIDGQNGAQIWSDRFDGGRSDLVALQDQITARIAHSIGREIFVVAARDSLSRKIDPDAADFLVRGIALADKNQTFDNLQHQERLFRSVIGLEPANGDAWARLGRAMLLQYVNFRSLVPSGETEGRLKEGAEVVEKALTLDPNSARAHLAEGVLFLALRNPSECARANENAIALDRNLALAYNNLGASLIHMGQPEKAIPIVEQAMRLDPLGPQITFMQANMGKANLFLGRTDAAIDWLLKARRSNPGIARNLAFLAAAYACKGDDTQASAIAGNLRHIAPQYRLSESPDGPGPFSSAPYLRLYEEILLPAARKAGVPE
jgi:adenylate cyclase